MNTEQERAKLLPCPFCGAGTTEIQENGRPWLGTRGWGDPVSVSVRHWCEPVDGQPSRMIERVGRDRAAAIAAWNRRAALQSQDREDAVERLIEVVRYYMSFGCPVCSGDCFSANPPVSACPVREAQEAIDHARRIEGDR